MKNEDKILITGLLFTLFGIVLYRIWKPGDEKNIVALAGTFGRQQIKKVEQPEILFDGSLEQQRAAAMQSLK